MLYYTVQECLDYELTQYPEEHPWQVEDWDTEATSRRIWRYLKERNTLSWLRGKQEWQQSEALHLAVIDWLSMYEPTTKERNN